MHIETVDWQGWLQYAVAQVGLGYYHYQVVVYPEHKRDRWNEIDQKMVERFDLVNHWKRSRRKQKGWANFLLARHGNRLLVLMSDGACPPHLSLEDETFTDIRKQPLTLVIGNVLRLNVSYSGGKVAVSMPSDLFEDWKASIVELAKTRSTKKMKRHLHILNGIPGYAGVNQQRTQLVRIAVKQLRKNQVSEVTVRSFYFYRGRKTRKVFKDE
jgi:hypothetical protein